MGLNVLIKLSLSAGAAGIILMLRGIRWPQSVPHVPRHLGPAGPELAPPQSCEQTGLTRLGFFTSSVMMTDVRNLIRATRMERVEYKKMKIDGYNHT